MHGVVTKPEQAPNRSLAGPSSAMDVPLHATSASWLNAVEGFFAILTKRRLKRGVFKGVVDFQVAISRFVADHNQRPKPFVWTADPDKIIAGAARGRQVVESIH